MTLKIDRREILAGAALAAGSSLIPIGAAAAAADTPAAGVSPDEALKRLVDGNERFVNDRPVTADITARRRLALAAGQAPFAALVGCADSRVGPEHLFGAGLGELFIVRTAGNYIDDAGFGSLAYAVAALKVPLIVVLGHEKCGAVAAATNLVVKNEQLPPALTRMVNPILPAVIDARAADATGDLVERSTQQNVRHVVKGLRETSDPLLAEARAKGALKIVGAYYELSTGRVHFFDRD